MVEAIELRKDTASRWWEEYTQALGNSKDFANVTIRSLILLNGGAIVVILATIANIASKNDKWAMNLVSNIKGSLYLFTLSLLLAVLSGGTAYVSYILMVIRIPSPADLSKYVEEGKLPTGAEYWKAEDLWMYVTMLLAVCSAAGFAFAAFYAINALSISIGVV